MPRMDSLNVDIGSNCKSCEALNKLLNLQLFQTSDVAKFGMC